MTQKLETERLETERPGTERLATEQLSYLFHLRGCVDFVFADSLSLSSRSAACFCFQASSLVSRSAFFCSSSDGLAGVDGLGDYTEVFSLVIGEIATSLTYCLAVYCQRFPACALSAAIPLTPPSGVSRVIAPLPHSITGVVSPISVFSIPTPTFSVSISVPRPVFRISVIARSIPSATAVYTIL